MKKLAVLLGLFACDDATMIVVDNQYSDGTNVEMVWWSETLVPDVVAPNAESPAYRTGPATDYAYALLDHGDGQLVAVHTTATLTAQRSSTLYVVIAGPTVDGDCQTPGSRPLTQAEADVITQSIFPAEFEGAIYDAATCKTARPAGPDGGAD